VVGDFILIDLKLVGAYLHELEPDRIASPTFPRVGRESDEGPSNRPGRIRPGRQFELLLDQLEDQLERVTHGTNSLKPIILEREVEFLFAIQYELDHLETHAPMLSGRLAVHNLNFFGLHQMQWSLRSLRCI
jgi:hypothetical protein